MTGHVWSGIGLLLGIPVVVALGWAYIRETLKVTR